MSFKFAKGQGATEYLVLFAVVLVIVLVVVALLGFFPGMGTGVTDSSSASYWSSTRPLSITTWSSVHSGTSTNFTLAMKNVGSGPILITGVVVGTSPTLSTSDIIVNSAGLSTTLQIGDTSSISTANFTKTLLCGSTYTSGTRYTAYLSLNYTDLNSGAANLTFSGSKPITGTCN